MQESTIFLRDTICYDHSFWKTSCTNMDEEEESIDFPNDDLNTTPVPDYPCDDYYFDYCDTEAKNCKTYVTYNTSTESKSSCNGDEYFCPRSRKCIQQKEVCDGVIHCVEGDDEDFENLCKDRFPEGKYFL